MSELLKKIDDVLPNDLRTRHSFFQLQYFVVGKEPTIQGKIRTCLCELQSKKDSIDSLLNEIEEEYDNKRLMELELKELNKVDVDGSIEIEKKEIQRRKLNRRLKSKDKRIESLKASLQGYEDECNFLLGIYFKLCEVEEPKPWDSLEVQAAYWNGKLSQELEAKLLMAQKPDAELTKMIMHLPDGMPVRDVMKRLLGKKHEQIEEKSEN